jgi:hypothetical protein
MREFRLAFDWAEKILARNVAWISVADAKVGPTLTMSTAMLGVLVALGGALPRGAVRRWSSRQ